MLSDENVETKMPEKFGQFTSACMTIKVPFAFVDDPQTFLAIEHSTENAVLNEKEFNDLRITSSVQECKQWRQVHREQTFAVL